MRNGQRDDLAIQRWVHVVSGEMNKTRNGGIGEGTDDLDQADKASNVLSVPDAGLCGADDEGAS